MAFVVGFLVGSCTPILLGAQRAERCGFFVLRLGERCEDPADTDSNEASGANDETQRARSSRAPCAGSSGTEDSDVAPAETPSAVEGAAEVSPGEVVAADVDGPSSSTGMAAWSAFCVVLASIRIRTVFLPGALASITCTPVDRCRNPESRRRHGGVVQLDDQARDSRLLGHRDHDARQTIFERANAFLCVLHASILPLSPGSGHGVMKHRPRRSVFAQALEARTRDSSGFGARSSS